MQAMRDRNILFFKDFLFWGYKYSRSEYGLSLFSLLNYQVYYEQDNNSPDSPCQDGTNPSFTKRDIKYGS